jgi:FkbM family methyltransferase
MSSYITGTETSIHLDYQYYHGELQTTGPVDKVLREYFPDPSYKGIFIDVGAYEPINISNSYHFEQNGWDVYCFEGNTDRIAELKTLRKNVYNVAVADTPKESVSFTVVQGKWGGGSQTAGLSAIELNPEYMERFKSGIKSTKTITVPQTTLSTILPSLIGSKKSIDILSIDVEGGEFNVLKGLNLKEYSVKVFVIENFFHHTSITAYLDEFGYKLDKCIEYNEYYIPK